MTARVIIVGNQKGGVGKTTVAVGLACAWASPSRPVILVDADPQRSAEQWLQHEPPGLEVVLHEGGPLDHLLPAVAKGAEIVVVDLPPCLVDTVRSAMAVADDLLIPVTPSPLDFAAAEALVGLARRHGSSELRGRFIINHRQSPRSGVARSAREALKAYGLPVCEQELHTRVAHCAAGIEGKSVLEYEPEGKAAAEVRALAAEVWGHA